MSDPKIITEKPAVTQNALTETVHQVTLQVIEEAAAPGKPMKVKVRGEFAKSDIATENKRVYPRAIWEREIGRLGKALENRQVFGELDHPADGRTMLQRASHILTNLHVTESGIVEGEAEILDTEQGKNLKALLQANCKVGVSSRGYGTTKPNDLGEDVVQEDYRLGTFDFVAEPADVDALPGVFYESKQKQQKLAEEAKVCMTETQIEAYRTEAREAAKTELRAEFAEFASKAIADGVAAAKVEAKAELLADPEIAGAKAALESVKEILRPFILPEDTAKIVATKDEAVVAKDAELAEAKTKIAALEEELSSAIRTAREVGYRFFVEQQIAGDVNAAVIRQLIGDVTSYEGSDAIKAKIETIKIEMAKKAEETRQAEEARRLAEAQAAEERRLAQEAVEKRENALAEHIAGLEQALKKSQEEARKAQLAVYIAERTSNHPKGAQIKALVEARGVSSEQEIEQIVSTFREVPQDPDVLESVRARVRNITRGGTGSTPLAEEQPAPMVGVGGNYNGLGVGIHDLKQLAGIPRSK